LAITGEKILCKSLGNDNYNPYFLLIERLVSRCIIKEILCRNPGLDAFVKKHISDHITDGRFHRGIIRQDILVEDTHLDGLQSNIPTGEAAKGEIDQQGDQQRRS